MNFTIWQTGHLWVTDYESASPELLAPYRGFGYRSVQVHMEDGGPVPKEYCDALRRLGFTVFGAFWVNPEIPPTDCAEWAALEAQRLGLRGIVANGEDPLEEMDASLMAQGKPSWSSIFCKRYRELLPGRGLALNCFDGCGYIDHAAWRKASARLYLQTFPGSKFGFVQSVSYLVGKAAEWGWGKARVKPCFGVYKYGGERPDPSTMVASAREAGTRGFTAYYADSTFDDADYMKSLAQQALAAGIAY